MVSLKEKYVVDEKGHKLEVLMSVKEYEKLVEYIEYMEDSLELKEAKKFETEKGVSLDKYLSGLKRK